MAYLAGTSVAIGPTCPVLPTPGRDTLHLGSVPTRGLLNLHPTLT